MDIQTEVQKIHHKFGVTEMANYKIQLFVDDLIETEKEQLRLHIVSQQREWLIAVFEKMNRSQITMLEIGDYEKLANELLSNLPSIR